MRQRSVVLSVVVTLLVAVTSSQQKAYGQSNPSAKPKAATAGTAQSHVLNVNVKLDAGHAATQHIPVEGDTLRASAADGTRYTLTLPKDALLKEVTVTMTPVSRVDGLHLSGKTVAAVHLAPEGLGLFKPATLLVEPGTPVPLKEQISFAFEGSGQKLHLYPLTKDPKIVAFDIMHFSGYGMGQGSAADAQSLSSVSQGSPEDQFLAALQQMGKDIRNMGDPEKLSEDEVQKDLEQQERDQKVVQEKYDEWGKLVIFPDLQAAEKRVLSCEELDRLAKQTFSWVAWMIKGAAEYNEEYIDATDDSFGRSILNTYDKAAADCNVDCMRHSVGMAVKGIGGKVAEKLAVDLDEVPAAEAKCAKDWKGTVTVTFAEKAEGNGGSVNGTGTLICQVRGTGTDANCSYQSHEELTGTGGTMVTTKNAKGGYTYVSASVTGDKLALTIGEVPVLVTVQGPIPIEPYTEPLNGGSYMLPASSDPKHQSGTWTDPNGGPMTKNTVTWNLSKQ